MFELIMPVEELEVRSRSPLFVAGQIWAVIDGVDFPGARWTDSPISVLGSLGTAIQAVRRGEVGEVYFFDGPYYLKFIPENRLDSTSLKIGVVAVCDRDSDEGVAWIRGKVALSEVMQKYQLTISFLRGWAESQGEAAVLDLLSHMPSVTPH
ncbi:hypothetical protein AB0L53_42135 [Nonomuraea sp. NPDC052129]|uniref:hypothetical protein n=1 Tax=Nonomuraea sp. NPDC052129 TaxID=3154651 RepID=UPI003440EDB5